MLWYVALGSAIGGGARYLLGTFIQTRTGAAFPVGTLVVNVAGSVAIGFILRYAIAGPLWASARTRGCSSRTASSAPTGGASDRL